MDTYSAPIERTNENELTAELEIVRTDPVISGLLHLIGGIVAIVDSNRQIIAANDSFLQITGINNPANAFGLRLGEALNCIHIHENPGGCGTTKFCSRCGAATAMAYSLHQNKPAAEKICALTVNKDGRQEDIALLVKSRPIEIDGKKFLLLFLQDITRQQQRAALERTFFHDVNNMLTGLVGACETLSLKNIEKNLVNIIYQASLRLKNEIDIQRCLLENDPDSYHPEWHETTTTRTIEELQSFFSNHPAIESKQVCFPDSYPDIPLKTNLSLLLRVLSNMVINALEATEKGGEVKIWLEDNGKLLSFCVWNKKEIPQDIALRIFQRNFSTKDGAGRGIGTYSMKLFGEKILGGQVNFTTSHEKGTVFRFSLPLYGEDMKEGERLDDPDT